MKRKQSEHTRRIQTKDGYKEITVNKGEKKKSNLLRNTLLAGGGLLTLGALVKRKEILKKIGSLKVAKKVDLNDTKNVLMDVTVPKTNKLSIVKKKPTPKKKPITLEDMWSRREGKKSVLVLSKDSGKAKRIDPNLQKNLVMDLRNPLDDKESKNLLNFFTGDTKSSLQPTKSNFLSTRMNSEFARRHDLNELDIYSLASYTEDGYVGINAVLRDQLKLDSTDGKTASLIARQLNQALDKLPTHNGMVYRGTRLPQDTIDKYDIGSEFKLEGFLSTTTIEEVTEQYSKLHVTPPGFETLKGTRAEVKQRTKKGNYNNIAKELGIKQPPLGKEVKLNIKSMNGKIVNQSVSSTTSDVEEIMFKSNSRFKVTNKRKEKGKWILDIDELPYGEFKYVREIVTFKKKKHLTDFRFFQRLSDRVYPVTE